MLFGTDEIFSIWSGCKNVVHKPEINVRLFALKIEVDHLDYLTYAYKT